MKISGARTEAFLSDPGAATRVVLFHGSDQGRVRENAARLISNTLDGSDDPFGLVDLDPSDIARDPASLADEANALSFTGGKRVISVRGAGDALNPVIDLVLSQEHCEALVVLEAGPLPARSKLRKLVESAADGAAIGCYADETGDLRSLATETFAEAGVEIAPDALEFVVGRMGGDRMVIRRELEKLLLYCGDGEPVTLEIAERVVGDTAELDLDDLIFAVVDGRHDRADRVLTRLLAEGTSAVAVIRAMVRHLDRLRLAAEHIAVGKSPEASLALLRPPVFYKHKAAFVKQLRSWRPERISEAIERLIEAELRCKSTGAPDTTICSRAILSVANLAAAQRRGSR